LHQFKVDRLVDDPKIAGEKRQRFADGFGARRDLEEDPGVARIGLLGEVQPEEAVVHRLGGQLEESALRSSRDALQ